MRFGYTVFCLVALGLTFGLERILRTGILRDRRFWIAMAIVGFFQLVVDGWLTCRPVVTYDERQFSGVRLGCPDVTGSGRGACRWRTCCSGSR